jgi:hypothetical protein
MTKRLQNKINKNLAIITKALAEIKEATKDQTINVIPLDKTEYEILLVNRVWVEDFIDEDTGQVVSLERKQPCVVTKVADRFIEAII